VPQVLAVHIYQEDGGEHCITGIFFDRPSQTFQDLRQWRVPNDRAEDFVLRSDQCELPFRCGLALLQARSNKRTVRTPK